MVRHVVAFRWAEGIGPDQIAEIEQGLAELASTIDTIRAYRFGPDLGINEGNADFAVVADFDDEAGYLRYRDDPVHQQLIREKIAPALAERTAVQLAIEP